MSYEGASYEVRDGETLLDAFLRGGANIAFSCRRGTCQVCMLQSHSGDPGPEATADLRQDQRDAGLLLPCQARPREDLVVAKPDPASVGVAIHVREREQLSATVVRLRFDAESNLGWRAGQFINIEHPSGALRSYSLASIHEQDFFLEIHVRKIPGGLVSNWLCDEVEVGEVLTMRGPSGACFYEPEFVDRDLLLVAGGTGLAPLIGIASDALRQGHGGQITLLHGSTSVDGIYQHDRLMALARTQPNFHYEAWLDGVVDERLPTGMSQGSVVDAAFAKDRAGVVLYLAGAPSMVHEARYRAVLAGVARADIRADPFEGSERFMPDDAAQVGRVAPDPELWAALDQGPGLTAILSDLYDLAFEDPRLSPFFHNVTKQRVREKQYEFLSDLFTGSGHYFGARPFNAHHWMVISDELFDYREELIEGVMRRHGLAEHLIRRWLAIHELFRRAIVKPARRGMVIDGIERVETGYEEVTLDFAGLCDGCQAEIAAGVAARHHLLTGLLYCSGCSATSDEPA